MQLPTVPGNATPRARQDALFCAPLAAACIDSLTLVIAHVSVFVCHVVVVVWRAHQLLLGIIAGAKIKWQGQTLLFCLVVRCKYPLAARVQLCGWMSQYECWMRFTPNDAIKFPKELDQFDGYLIANMIIDTVVSGGRDLRPGLVIVIKGNMPSMHPAFRYHLRFKYNAPKPDNAYGGNGDYELLPKAGFRGSQRIPWTMETLNWSLQHEVVFGATFARTDIDRALMVLAPPGSGLGFVIEEAALKGQSFYDTLHDQSDYYRLSGIMAVRKAYPGSIVAIRKLPADVLARLTDHLNTAPHELCFYGHSRHYGLGEMSAAAFVDIMNEARIAGLDTTMTTKTIQMAAVAFYGSLKEMRLRYGHTIFNAQPSVESFARSSHAYGRMASAAMHWLAREGHLLFLDAAGVCLPRERWFDESSPISYLQFPRDDLLKERITGHLRRIFRNFLAAEGKFTVRPPEAPTPAIPGGELNERQRLAMDHILNNPLTIIQGGPGSGKTFEGVDHLASIFHWTEILTHVGRQAVSLCDRLGGSTEIACTIHSAHFRQKDNPIRMAYSAKKEILILDEVYNADDWTFEAALAIAPNVSRLVMVGDPDQIRPIPDEKGAGTPALDIARAFPEHVIFLNENMRQKENARAIHEVVTAIRTKQPHAIQWSSDLAVGAAVLVRQPPAGSFQSVMHSIIQRLRSDIGGDEHAWQLITFFNGTKPDTQGLGVNQLNECVEKYLVDTGYFNEKVKSTGKRRVTHKITNRLSMYVGFKFMITEKCIPHPSINGGKKKSNGGGTYASRRKVAFVPGRKTTAEPAGYTETRNGQIEVVASMRQINVKQAGTRGTTSWLIECVPKGKCVRGARILLNRKLHVDPSKVCSAWAVTSNKSMGGECKNVGVYIPPHIEASGFDRSNLYVAVSRPTDFLCILGERSNISALTMRDPKMIDSGLFTRLKFAKFLPECPLDDDDEEHRQRLQEFDWKEAHRLEEYGHIVPDVCEMLNVYDQSGRTASREVVAACPVSYKDFSIAQKRAIKTMDVRLAKKQNIDLFMRFKHQLYEGVPNNVRKFTPFGQPEPSPPPAAATADDDAVPSPLDCEDLILLPDDEDDHVVAPKRQCRGPEVDGEDDDDDDEDGDIQMVDVSE